MIGSIVVLTTLILVCIAVIALATTFLFRRQNTGEMIEPDLEDLLASSIWVCEKCEVPFATKELAEKHELKCDLKEDVENLEKILEKTEKVPEVEESSMEKLEKLIERRNIGEVTSEEFEETKKEILERKPQYSKELTEIAQEEADVPKKENQNGMVSKSNIGASDDDKFAKLDRLAEIKEKGLIDDAEFKQMKKEILGK